MIIEAFGTGDSIENARLAALKELGLSEEQTEYNIETEIIEYPEKKLFGLFGGKSAKVRLFYEIKEDKKAEIKEVKEVKESAGALKVEEGKENPAVIAADYLKMIVTGLGVENANITVDEKKGGALLGIEGEKMGLVIGRRGETLDAIQYLTSLVANNANGSYYKISINTGNYREKRDDTLTGLAKRTGALVLRIKKNVSFEPMNPYERRIIHTTIQDMEGVTSWSVGEGDKRHVVIGLEGAEVEGADGKLLSDVVRDKRRYDERRRQNRRYNNNRGGNGGYNKNRSGGYRGNKNYNTVKSEVEDTPSNENAIINIERKNKLENISAPLYGKIDVNK